MLYNKFYDLTENDYSFLEELSEYEASISGTFEQFSRQLNSSDKYLTLLLFLKSFIDHEEFDALAAFIGKSLPLITEANERSADIGRVVVVGLKCGIADGNGNCACAFGALYYNGDVVERDYDRARQLYELALEDDCTQAAINLGYIYEYGRCGEPDFPRAFSYYAYAATLEDMPEAIYKMGDFYYNGRCGVADKWAGYNLWTRAYDIAQDEIDRGCAAFRLAEHMSDMFEHPSREAVVEALQYYQEAEIGFLLALDAGYEYYRKQYERSIQGQQHMRDVLVDIPF